MCLCVCYHLISVTMSHHFQLIEQDVKSHNYKDLKVQMYYCEDVNLYANILIGKVIIFHLFTDKKGPVYSVEWSPNAKEFCVVYGCIHT